MMYISSIDHAGTSSGNNKYRRHCLLLIATVAESLNG